MTPEGIVKNRILKYLKNIPGMSVFPIATTGMFDPVRKIYRKTTMRKGTPDILCCYGGRFIGIEVKSESGKLSNEQRDVLADIIKCGGHAFIARDLNSVINEFERVLKSE